jgi:CRP-like cAMP-binding protein
LDRETFFVEFSCTIPSTICVSLPARYVRKSRFITPMEFLSRGGIMTTIEVLKRSFLFKSLPDDQVENIARLGQEKSFRAGEEIFKQGNRAKTLYVLLSGQISVRVKDNEEADLMAKTLEEPGAVLGTVALVKPHVYNVTAEAVSKARTFAIESHRLSEFMTANPLMGFSIMTCLNQSYLHRLNVKRTGMINLFKAFMSRTHKPEIFDIYREVA